MEEWKLNVVVVRMSVLRSEDERASGFCMHRIVSVDMEFYSTLFLNPDVLLGSSEPLSKPNIMQSPQVQFYMN